MSVKALMFGIHQVVFSNFALIFCFSLSLFSSFFPPPHPLSFLPLSFFLCNGLSPAVKSLLSGMGAAYAVLVIHIFL
jgi:hypothetical protein